MHGPFSIGLGRISTPPWWSSGISGLAREKERRPGENRDRQVDERQERDHVVDPSQVQHDAKGNRDELRAGKAGNRARDGHGRADQRVSLDAGTPDADAEVGEDAVEALYNQKTDDHQVPERASGRVPPSVQMPHGLK